MTRTIKNRPAETLTLGGAVTYALTALLAGASFGSVLPVLATAAIPAIVSLIVSRAQRRRAIAILAEVHNAADDVFEAIMHGAKPADPVAAELGLDHLTADDIAALRSLVRADEQDGQA